MSAVVRSPFPKIIQSGAEQSFILPGADTQVGSIGRRLVKLLLGRAMEEAETAADHVTAPTGSDRGSLPRSGSKRRNISKSEAHQAMHDIERGVAAMCLEPATAFHIGQSLSRCIPYCAAPSFATPVPSPAIFRCLARFPVPSVLLLACLLPSTSLSVFSICRISHASPPCRPAMLALAALAALVPVVLAQSSANSASASAAVSSAAAVSSSTLTPANIQ